MGAGRCAQLHQQVTIKRVRPNGGHHDLCAGTHLHQRVFVSRVGHNKLDPRQPDRIAELLQLAA